MIDGYGFNKFIVVPFYATGSTMDGTKQYNWKAVFSRFFRLSNVGRTYESQEEAQLVADQLTNCNEPF